MARTALLAMAVKSPPTMEAHATASRTTQGQQHIKQLLVKALRWELDPLQARRKQQSGKSIQLVKGRPVSSTRRDRPFSFRQLPPPRHGAKNRSILCSDEVVTKPAAACRGDWQYLTGFR